MKGLFVRSIVREKKNGSGARRPGIVVYETTHHENLPALLDLCETRFPRVVVFLKESSWKNLTGSERPSDRWPKTEFIRQPAGSSNRVFIRQLFALLSRQRYSHLHLSTLDNNLLIFAWRIGMAGDLHVSLTVHEVNAWLADSYRSVRAVSETFAKRFLRRRIKHYTFFLPAVAEHFNSRMPDATAVFLPSRFYAKTSSRASGSRLTVVVPGSVEANRRDYERVAEFFETWRPSRAVRLVLLGDSDSDYGDGIVGRLTRLESPVFELVYFKGYIPETLYEEQFRQADLVWSPLCVHKTGGHDEPEIYGLTTASGLTADLLLNNIPALVPADFGVPEPFRAALLSYESMADIARHFDAALSDDLRRDIDAAFSFFKKESFYAAFDRLMFAGHPRDKR